MTLRTNTIGLLFAVLSATAVTTPVHATETDQPWKAGASRVVITPSQPMWMAGYAARNRPSEGKVHDLFAKALAFEDSHGTRLVIVTTDLIGIPRALRDSVLEAVATRHHLKRESLVLNASHTHCGPELRAGKAALYGLEPKRVEQARRYLDALQGKLVQLIGDALSDLKPARLLYTRARAGFAMNRRLPTASGIRNSPNPNGPVDHDVPVLRVESTQGKLRAVLFGYACHNTTMGFYKFLGDYAGYAQYAIERRHPDVTALFMMGCGGDQNPYPRSKLELAEQHGQTLANAVETALQVLQPRVVTGPLTVSEQEVELQFASPPSREELVRLKSSSNKYDQRRASTLLRQWERNGRIQDTYAYPIQVSRFGKSLTLVTLSGEVVVDYALRLKAELPGPAAVWVAGYSHDVFGYVPSRRVLLEGGYEGGGAMRYTTLPGPFAPSVEQRIVQGVHTLLAKPQAKK